MSTWRLSIALAVLVVGCAGSSSVGSPSAASTVSMAPASIASAESSMRASSTTPPSAAVPSATAAAGAGKFTVCPQPVDGPICPLPPAKYTAAVHDAFAFSIPEAGWQEERAVAGEFDTRVVLSRVDDPTHRVTFLSGLTGPASPVTVDPATFAIPGFTAGTPKDVNIAGTSAKSIELEPADAQTASSVTIENQSIRLEPDRRYRFTLAKIGMMEEAATVIIVTEAPADEFAAFVPTADGVLQTVSF